MEPSQRRRAVLTQIAGWYILAGAAGLLLFTVPDPSWKDCRIAGRHLICHPLRNEARMLTALYRDSVYFALLVSLVVAAAMALVMLRWTAPPSNSWASTTFRATRRRRKPA